MDDAKFCIFAQTTSVTNLLIGYYKKYTRCLVRMIDARCHHIVTTMILGLEIFNTFAIQRKVFDELTPFERVYMASE